MTHTLHRAGTQQNLSDDFTILCMPARGVNVTGSGLKMRRFLEIASMNNAVNIGDIDTGNLYVASQESIIGNVRDGGIVHAVFACKKDVLAVLTQLKEEDLGMSVVVQGLCEEVYALTEKAGLQPHTVNHSLGRWGRQELLPEPEVLEITTMCGHALVSAKLVAHLADRIAHGRTSPESAARELARQCICGIFNPTRAQRLLENMADALRASREIEGDQS